MIIARATNGALVDADQADRAAAYACPLCDAEPLTLKRGSIIAPHFAHPPSATCTEHEPESAVHIAMKRTAQELFGGQLESVLGSRRADVLAPGERVIECQASSITIEEVSERTADWTAAGFEVLWIWRSGLLGRAHECWCGDAATEAGQYGGGAWGAEFERLERNCELGCAHRIPAAILATAVPDGGYSRIVVYDETTKRVYAAHLRDADGRKTIRRFKLAGEVHGLTDGQELPLGTDGTIWTQHRTTDHWDICGHERRLPAGLRLTTPTRYTRR